MAVNTNNNNNNNNNKNNNNKNNNNNIYTGGVLALSGFSEWPFEKYYKDVKAIQGNTT